MSKKDEALKLALEALEKLVRFESDSWELGSCRVAGQAIKALREALAEQPAQQEVDWEKLYRLEVKKKDALAAKYERDTGKKLTRIIPMAEQPAQQEPEFFKHTVEQPYDWSEWVCPDPKGYLMKCCGCGLVHEAEFGVVRYKSATEREDCEPVDDPNIQAVFRMRRSEQWSPEDTAHRAGGLPMEQPAQQQEPVAWMNPHGGMLTANYIENFASGLDKEIHNIPLYTSPQPAQQEPVAWRWKHGDSCWQLEDVQPRSPTAQPLYTSPQAQRTWVGLNDEEKSDLWCESTGRDCVNEDTHVFADAIEAKLKERNT